MMRFLRLAAALLCLLPGLALAQDALPPGVRIGGPVDTNTVTPPGGTPRTLVSRSSDIIWARDYGVRCDAVTDDAPALRSLLLLLPGRSIRLPGGFCNLGSPVPVTAPGTVIEGEGPASTRISYTGTLSAGQSAISFAPTNASTGARLSNTGLRNLAIGSSVSQSAGNGVQLVSTTGFYLHNVHINNFFVGADLSGVSNVFVDGVQIYTGGYWSTLQVGSKYLTIRSGPSATSGKAQVSYGVFITKSSLSSAVPSPIAPLVERGLEITGADGVYVSGGSYIGEAKYNSYVVLEDNAATLGTYISNVSWVGSFMDGNLQQSLAGIYMAFNANSGSASMGPFAITGNLITGNQTYAVFVGTGAVTRVTGTGNILQGGGGWCVQVSSSQGTTWTGNVCAGTGSPGNLTTGGFYFGSGNVGSHVASGNEFQNMQSGSAGVRVDANSSASFSLTGNSFSTSGLNEIYKPGTVANLEQWGNATVNAAAIPNIAKGPVKLPSYTVSTLPACSGAQDYTAVVTDATTPTYGGALTGGGTTRTLAYCNGTSWTAH